eukprot:130132-Rhodomonas_salina.1
MAHAQVDVAVRAMLVCGESDDSEGICRLGASSMGIFIVIQCLKITHVARVLLLRLQGRLALLDGSLELDGTLDLFLLLGEIVLKDALAFVRFLTRGARVGRCLGLRLVHHASGWTFGPLALRLGVLTAVISLDMATDLLQEVVDLLLQRCNHVGLDGDLIRSSGCAVAAAALSSTAAEFAIAKAGDVKGRLSSLASNSMSLVSALAHALPSGV